MNIKENNERFLRVVVRAALEDLASARMAHGAGSLAYARQAQHSISLIRGNLEAVLAAADTQLLNRQAGAAGHAAGNDEEYEP